jgi:hypothetical protein
MARKTKVCVQRGENIQQFQAQYLYNTVKQHK